MPPVEYIILVNGVKFFSTSINSSKDAVCEFLKVKNMEYVVEEKRLKF